MFSTITTAFGGDTAIRVLRSNLRVGSQFALNVSKLDFEEALNTLKNLKNEDHVPVCDICKALAVLENAKPYLNDYLSGYLGRTLVKYRSMLREEMHKPDSISSKVEETPKASMILSKLRLAPTWGKIWVLYMELTGVEDDSQRDLPGRQGSRNAIEGEDSEKNLQQEARELNAKVELLYFLERHIEAVIDAVNGKPKLATEAGNFKEPFVQQVRRRFEQAAVAAITNGIDPAETSSIMTAITTGLNTPVGTGGRTLGQIIAPEVD